MYSRYARMGRRPFKLRLLSQDAAVLTLPFVSRSRRVRVSPRDEVAVYFPVQRKQNKVRANAPPLVAGSPQGGALTLGGSEGVSVGQQSLPELGFTVTRDYGQLHRLVEGVFLRRRERRCLSRSAR